MIDLSFICPVHNKSPYIRGFIHSLLEQDIWDNCELIMVENASTDNSWEEMNKVVDKLPAKKRKNIILLQTKAANRCSAINEGVKHATGRYWSFLPADASLFPGAARTWVESLDEFPEYGFLYGGYRFSPPHGGVYMSESFDPELLKQYNYVDGSFPIRKELYPYFNNGGHDPQIKSLNDWDFWLAVIMGPDHKGSGIKGLYRPEVFFETIPPEPGGLSDDSHKNWLERTKQIKDKWEIKESEICVTSPGAPFHAKNIAKILKADYRAMPSFKPHNFKMIYELGFYPQRAQECAAVFMTPEGKFANTIRVIHWVGSDIWGLQNMSLLQVKQLKAQLDQANMIHLVEFEQTQNELKELGIDARIVPLPPAKLYEPMPLPKKFTVAVYMPSQNADFYYKELITEVAHSLPEIDFLFFGDRFNLSKDKNIQNVGYIEDMSKLIADSSAIVRLSIHDGLPLSLVEFVTAGRNALFNIKMPHMMYVNTGNKDVIRQRILDLQKLPLNEAGSKYYRELMDHNKFRQTINNLLIEGSGYEPKRYWESRAESWELQAPHGQFPHSKEIEAALEDIDYSSVFDVGCGNGRWSHFFKEKNKHYVGVDISEKLVSIAKEHYPEAEFYYGKVEDIPDRTKFDLVFSYTCLQHVKPDDIAKAAKKLKKISKYTILIESPTGWPEGSYGFNYDYSKYFNIIKTIKAEKAADNENETLTIMLAKNKED